MNKILKKLLKQFYFLLKRLWKENKNDFNDFK